MYTFEVLPFVEVTVATTEEELGLLHRKCAFVKPPLGGTSRGNLDDVHKQWSQEIVRDNMRNSSPQFPPLDGVGQLSVAVVIQAAESIIDSFDGVTHEDDVFYLVYSRTISHRAAGIRNILQVAEGPETTKKEINGVLYHQKRPFTYWLAIPGHSKHSHVKLALYQSGFFEDIDGPNGWCLLRHSPTHPILTCYVSPEEPALQGESTFAVADTFEVEERAFTIFQDAVRQSGTLTCDAVSHPNGTGQFPDYQAIIGTQSWAVEITRPLGTMVQGRVITMDTTRTPQDISRAASLSGLGPSDIRDGLTKATKDKSYGRKHLDRDEKYCLLLVDTTGMIDTEDPEQWEDCQLDAYDSVVLLRLIPDRTNKITAVKRGIPLNSA